MRNDQWVAELIDRVENRYFGKYRAQVADNADPEHRGRLRLRVPGLLGEDVVTGWALPCVPYGGSAGVGSLWIPDNDAGVWVEFEGGQLEYPVWVGAYWCSPGGQSELPLPNETDGAESSAPQSPPTRKIFKTAAGHTLQFEDAAGEEGKIFLVDGVNGHVVVLGDKGISITHGVSGDAIVMDDSGISITSGDASSGTLINLGSDGVRVSTKKDFSLEAQNITLHATANMTIVGETLVDINP